MLTALLTTKLYVPPPRPDVVPRPRLLQRLNEGLRQGHRLTLVSAPAGFGKTTLLSEWVATCGRPVAWLALDSGDNDPARFLAYLIAALQTIEDGMGVGVLDRFQAPQPPPMEELLTALINQIDAISIGFVLDSLPVRCC
jgi:LuxR family maltose regulon positive regulatory protein